MAARHCGSIDGSEKAGPHTCSSNIMAGWSEVGVPDNVMRVRSQQGPGLVKDNLIRGTDQSTSQRNASNVHNG